MNKEFDDFMSNDDFIKDMDLPTEKGRAIYCKEAKQEIEQLQKENEKERKGRERLRNIYAEKLTENLGLKERIEEAFKLVENIDGRHLSFDDVRSDLLELLNKQN